LGGYFAKIEIENNEETRKIADRIIENSQAQMLNGFAWKILTEVKEENRDLAIVTYGQSPLIRVEIRDLRYIFGASFNSRRRRA